MLLNRVRLIGDGQGGKRFEAAKDYDEADYGDVVRTTKKGKEAYGIYVVGADNEPRIWFPDGDFS